MVRLQSPYRNGVPLGDLVEAGGSRAPRRPLHFGGLVQEDFYTLHTGGVEVPGSTSFPQKVPEMGELFPKASACNSCQAMRK